MLNITNTNLYKNIRQIAGVLLEGHEMNQYAFVKLVNYISEVILKGPEIIYIRNDPVGNTQSGSIVPDGELQLGGGGGIKLQVIGAPDSGNTPDSGSSEEISFYIGDNIQTDDEFAQELITWLATLIDIKLEYYIDNESDDEDDDDDDNDTGK